MLAKSLIATGALALLSMAAYFPIQETLDRQDFSDCDLDIRASNRPEVQLWWEPITTPDPGLRYKIRVSEGSLVKFSEPSLTPAHELFLRPNVINIAEFKYDRATRQVTMVLYDGDPADPQTRATVPYVVPGNWNPQPADVVPPVKIKGIDSANVERWLVKGSYFNMEFFVQFTRYL